MIIDKAYYVVSGEHLCFGINNEIPPIGELEIGEELNYDAMKKFLYKCRRKRVNDGIIDNLIGRLAFDESYGFRVFFEYQQAVGIGLDIAKYSSVDLTIYEVSCTRDTFTKVETDGIYIKEQYYYKNMTINRVVYRKYNTYVEYGHENFKVPG